MRAREILLFLNLIIGLTCSAQVTAYYKTQSIETLYSIPDTAKKHLFFFPSYERFPAVNEVYEVRKDTVFLLRKSDTDINKRESSLIVRYYAQNVAKIHFKIGGDDEKTLVVDNNGFNSPRIEKVSLKEIGELKEIGINVEPTDPKKSFRLCFAELEIANNHIGKKVSPSPFFERPPFDNAKFKSEIVTSPFDSYGELAYFPEGEVEEDFKGVVYVEKNDREIELLPLLKRIFWELLKEYPFYKIKGIDKEEYLLTSKVFLDNLKGPKCSVIDSINTYIDATLNDPHFFIKSNCKKERKITPIYTYPLAGEHIVAVILDEGLKQRIPLGSIIIKINNTSVKGLDTNIVNNEILKSKEGERILLEYETPDRRQPGKIDYVIKSRYEIPENFRVDNLLVKQIHDSVSYLKINKITYELPQAYLNHSSVLNSSKKLILDFRGCTGGDFLAGAQFLSYLLPDGFKYFEYEVRKTKKIEPVIVNKSKSPDNFREDGQIIILMDNTTACIGELLIYAIKENRNRTLILGKDSHTKGALSFVYEINLFDDIKILTNSLDTGRMLLGENSIEGKGIPSDIVVPINSVNDLQPYEDKVLKEAILK